MRRPSTEQAVPSWYTCNSQPKAAETNLAGMPVMTLLPPSGPSLATSPTTMPRASSFWRSACLLWPTSVVRPLPFEDFTSVVKEVAKQGNDFRTLNKVLAEDDMEQVLKHYYIRAGGNLRALDLILRNVSREVRKVRMRSSSGLSSGTTGGWNQLKRNWMTRK